MAIKTVSSQIAEILNDYSDEAKSALAESAKDAAEETVKQLKSTSPGGGKYARSWKVKDESTRTNPSYIVHNVRHYRLTHLLENGHLISNQYGSYGREPAQKHIAPAEQMGISKFEQLVRRELD